MVTSTQSGAFWILSTWETTKCKKHYFLINQNIIMASGLRQGLRILHGLHLLVIPIIMCCLFQNPCSENHFFGDPSVLPMFRCILAALSSLMINTDAMWIYRVATTMHALKLYQYLIGKELEIRLSSFLGHTSYNIILESIVFMYSFPNYFMLELLLYNISVDHTFSPTCCCCLYNLSISWFPFWSITLLNI